MEGLVHTVYVCLPLAFIIVVQYCPQFDLTALARLFLWCMLPLDIVGAIQYFADPAFMISSAYSVEGGIIARNFLSEGSFSRYPSIFVSADRFSAMGLMQLYFAVLLLVSPSNLSWRRLSWISFNIISAGGALLISGARSRIIIAFAALALVIVAFALKRPFAAAGKAPRFVGRLIALISVLLITVYQLVEIYHPARTRSSSRPPVITFLAESLERGDIQGRVREAASVSAIPDEVTWFGKGLGTEGSGGKPGEFGIRSMWLESGLVWGSLMLVAFGGICSVLFRLTHRAFSRPHFVENAVYSIPLLLLLFSLGAGLTSGFELSSGILLGCSIGAITRQTKARPFVASLQSEGMSVAARWRIWLSQGVLGATAADKPQRYSPLIDD
jgi:hypothetical protein